MSIMEEIYKGKLFPSEQVVPPKDSEYWNVQRKVGLLLEALEANLKEEDYAKVRELCDDLSDSQDMMCIEFYKFGLSMGLLLMKEATENPYLPKEGK